MRVRAAIGAVVYVEDRFVGHPAAHIVRVPSFAVIHQVLCGDRSVIDKPLEQRDALVIFRHQHVTQAMRHGERAEGADGIGKQRMRAIKRIDEPAAIRHACPASRLNSSRDF